MFACSWIWTLDHMLFVQAYTKPMDNNNEEQGGLEETNYVLKVIAQYRQGD